MLSHHYCTKGRTGGNLSQTGMYKSSELRLRRRIDCGEKWHYRTGARHNYRSAFSTMLVEENYLWQSQHWDVKIVFKTECLVS